MNLQDLLRGPSIYRGDLGALAAANAFGGFGVERSTAIWAVEAVPYAPILDNEMPYQFEPETEQERMERNFASFASTLGRHPCALIREQHWPCDVKVRKPGQSKDIPFCKNGSMVDAFDLVLVRQAPESAKGMEFVTLEDQNGMINLCFAPNKIAAHLHEIHNQGFLRISGILQQSGEGHSILAKKVRLRKDINQNVAAFPEKKRTRTPDCHNEILKQLPLTRNFH